MGMNRYNAATGKREYLPEQERLPSMPKETPRPSAGRGGNGMDLSAIFNRLSPQRLEQEDLDRIEGWISKYDLPVSVIRH